MSVGKMDRINIIISHELYRQYINKIENHEKEREFCRHDKKHFMDVCRLAYLFYLEDEELSEMLTYGKSQVKELLYAAGLLHDIGRWKEYEEGIPHEIASAGLAEPILTDAGFADEEKEEILRIILVHRKKEVKEEKSLAGVFYRADKSSRECFWCPAEGKCDWEKTKKNLSIEN